MPAAAVTPAPIAYIKVVAVKKLVVGYLGETPDPPGFFWVFVSVVVSPIRPVSLFRCGASSLPEAQSGSFTLKKLECSKQAFLPLNTLAWNNKIRLLVLFCWFRDQSND